jgi:hypothetical protein
MKRHQTHTFATRSDLEGGLRALESQRRLKYVPLFRYSTGSAGKPIVVPHKSPEFEEYASLVGRSSLGVNLTGDHNSGDHYLVIDAGVEVRFESVLQRKGGVHYFVNQLLNPTSITFLTGGLYENRFLICGHIGTISEHPQSIELYKAFKKALTKGFKTVGNYRVGPEALRLMDQGVRMITMGVDEPPEYDLRRT